LNLFIKKINFKILEKMVDDKKIFFLKKEKEKKIYHESTISQNK